MRLSSTLISMLLYVYQRMNRAGLLDKPWVRKVFTVAYFYYKKYVEDPFLPLTQRFPQLFRDGHILDIGANIGYTSYVFSKVMTRAFRIYAFEPECKNFESLQKTIQLYGLGDQVIPIHSAVGEQTGMIDLWENEDHGADHRVLTKQLAQGLDQNIKKQRIPLTTVDTFLKTRGEAGKISFIKIDVQGYETAVCQGMKETLLAHPNITVAIEFCPEMISGLGFRPEDLLKYFVGLGFHLYILKKNGHLFQIQPSELVDYVNRKTSLGYVDLLCSRNNLLQNSPPPV